MPRNLFIFVLLSGVMGAFSQELPDYGRMMATFGNMSGDSCIDDDFSQVIFYALPDDYVDGIYLRIYDPDCGGSLDRPNGLWETNTIFELFGGPGCISEKDARGTAPVGNYKSGKLLQRELFAKESVVDREWVTLGPFQAKQGEQLDMYPGYVFFKLLIEGRTGNDGNVYGLFLSSSPDKNTGIPHSSFFTYEQVALEGNTLVVSRADKELLGTNEVLLPVQLDPIKTTPGYDIIAVPVPE